MLSAKKGGGLADSDVVTPDAVASERGTLEPLPSATVPLDVQSPDYDECKFCHAPKANALTKLSLKSNPGVSAGVVLLGPQARTASTMSKGTSSTAGPGCAYSPSLAHIAISPLAVKASDQ